MFKRKEGKGGTGGKGGSFISYLPTVYERYRSQIVNSSMYQEEFGWLNKDEKERIFRPALDLNKSHADVACLNAGHNCEINRSAVASPRKFTNQCRNIIQLNSLTTAM